VDGQLGHDETLTQSKSTSATLSEDEVLLLCPDVVQIMFGQLDLWSLVNAAAVCSLWRSAASVDFLWGALARKRWNLPDKRGRYKFGERSWSEVYRVFHRRLRMPLFAGVGEREVVYASGWSSRVGVWLLVNHGPACALAQRWGTDHACKLLSCRILVHNLRDTPITVDGQNGLMVAMRDGSISQPWLDGALTPPWGDAADAADRQSLRLEPMQAGLLTDVQFRMPAHMRFEPDALEAAQTLHVSVAGWDRRTGGSTSLQVPCALADDALIWAHYEEINREFFIHVDKE